MTSTDAVEDVVGLVGDFLKQVEAQEDEDDRLYELRRISSLIRGVRSFYEHFLHERYELRIEGFSYRSKRAVARKLVHAERHLRGHSDDDAKTALDLGAMYEDLCDLLHGDLEFGYSENDDDYVEFHLQAFPTWLELVAARMRIDDRSDLADRVDEEADRYLNVFSAIF
jgi:hypothetical protein